MDDSVGDILAQRAKLDSGAGVAIFFSVLLHATLTAIAAWSAWHHASTAATPLVMIRLAPQQAAPELTAAPSTPAAPQPVAAPQPKPIDKKKFAPPSPYGKSAKKAAEIPAPVPKQPTVPAAAPTAPPTTTAADVPVGGSGVAALDSDFPFPLYIEQMKRLIGSHWARPAASDQTTATIYFVINRDGSVRDSKPEIPSGNGSYDRAALRAVLEASPLPPLPFAYNGTYLGVHLKFR